VLVVAVLDVGSATRTGWWRSPLAGPSTEGRNVDELCAELADDLFSGNAVAVGFEAPLWVPYANDATQLGKARPGEHPSWSAGAGATVLAYGIQQMTYVLHRLAVATSQAPPPATLDPHELRVGTAQLLVWEAFVSGRGKDRTALEPHISDARAAGQEFSRRWATGSVASDLDDVDTISIAGLALVLTGLRVDLGALSSAPIVVHAPDRP
jgi:hypothetical protein